MELFRYSRSIYSRQTEMIGASWDLLPWFAAAGLVFILVHAAIMLIARRRRS